LTSPRTAGEDGHAGGRIRLPFQNRATLADAGAADNSPGRARTSAAPGVEALHDAATVGPRLLDVASSGVLADDAPPERLGLDVPRELRDLPLAGEGVEHPAGDLGADPLTAVPAQDEELADVPGAVAREVGAFAHQREADEDAVDVDEIGRHPRIRPEPLDDLRVAVKTVVADGPVVDRGEVVEVELHEPPQDRKVLGARGSQLDLHDVMLGYR